MARRDNDFFYDGMNILKCLPDLRFGLPCPLFLLTTDPDTLEVDRVPFILCVVLPTALEMGVQVIVLPDSLFVFLPLPADLLVMGGLACTLSWLRIPAA